MGLPERARFSDLNVAAQGKEILNFPSTDLTFCQPFWAIAAAQNIRVNCVCPGSVDTPMISAVFETSDDPERIRCEYRAKHPLGRVATPEEVARAVLYLTSNDSSFVTGASLPVDGGITAG